MELEKLLKQIEPENAAARESAHRHWNNCAKPLGGLGMLETALEDQTEYVCLTLPAGGGKA